MINDWIKAGQHTLFPEYITDIMKHKQSAIQRRDGDETEQNQ